MNECKMLEIMEDLECADEAIKWMENLSAKLNSGWETE